MDTQHNDGDAQKNAPRRVAIQGVAGCFHDEVARLWFGSDGSEVTTLECRSFADMFEALEADATLLGTIAIENTIAGALLQNLELIRKSNLTIVGEKKMRISHCLCALPGATISSLREIWSHPMALLQCEQFLRRHPSAAAVEKFDTAGSARDIATTQAEGVGAVCSAYAARLYGLDVLEDGIETNKRNFTRFLMLADPAVATDLRAPEHEVDKASVVFTLPHTNGALSKVLTIWNFYDMNLTGLQSMPIVGRAWEYRFYADLSFESMLRYRQALEAVRPLVNDLRVLGEYSSDKSYEQD